MKKFQTKSPSLVLSGGGMKAAAFHIGVSLALEEFGLYTTDKNKDSIVFDRYIGASAGSVISAFFAAGYSPQDVVYAFTQGEHSLESLNVANLEPSVKLAPLRYRDIFSLNLENSNPKKWIPGFLSGAGGLISKGGLETTFKKFFKISGFFSTKGLGEYFIENILKDNQSSFEDLKKDLFIVATYLDKPRKAVFSKYEGPRTKTSSDKADYLTHVDVASAITASAALPPIFSPVTIDGDVFFDGEVRDSLNSHIALDQKSDLVIVSYSMQPYQYNDDFGSLNQYGLPVIANQALYQLIQQKIINHRKSKENLDGLLTDLEKTLPKYLEKEDAQKIVSKLEKKFFPARKAKVIYIHPSSQDHEMFFADHLSLKPEVLNKIVTIGFKAAMKSLKGQAFEKA